MGASGDLVQLAHIALALIGEGVYELILFDIASRRILAQKEVKDKDLVV